MASRPGRAIPPCDCGATFDRDQIICCVIFDSPMTWTSKSRFEETGLCAAHTKWKSEKKKRRAGVALR